MESKVKFLDEHIENYNQENSALHRKLQSKVESLKIMRNELERFRQERDQFKLMAETLQMRYTAIKKSVSDYGNFDYTDKSSVAALVNETREKNISLTTEVETLKQKLSELQGDIKALRTQSVVLSSSTQKFTNPGEKDEKTKIWTEEKSKFIVQLETLKKKNAQLQYDFRALLDEKEEIVTERDAYKCKVHRLNHELNVALKAQDTNKVLDIDALVLENKYLQERLKNLEIELELLQQSLLKYKTMLDTKRKKGIIKLGTNNSDMIMSHKQVKNLLERGTLSEIPLNASTISDLKSLCLTLLDNLNDKNLAFVHQKKANKILATRIAELEQRLQSVFGVNQDLPLSTISPSQILLNGYTSSTVDQEQSTSRSDSGTTSSDSGSKNLDADHLSLESNKSNELSEYDKVYAESYSSSEYSNTIANNSCDDEEKIQELPPVLAAMVENALKEMNLNNTDDDDNDNDDDN